MTERNIPGYKAIFVFLVWGFHPGDKKIMIETNMTIKTLAGQRLMAGFDGTDLDDET